MIRRLVAVYTAEHGGRVTRVTREQWLARAVDRLRPALHDLAGLTVPEVRISCGDLGLHRQGRCFPTDWTADEVPEIAISLRHRPAAAPIVGTLIHYMIHAAGVRKHYRDFQAAAAHCGLVRLESTWATAGYRGDAADAPPAVYGILESPGPWPAPKLQPDERQPRQGTRMLRVQCEECSMIWRSTARYLHNDVRCPQPDCDGAQQVHWPADTPATETPEQTESSPEAGIEFVNERHGNVTRPTWWIGRTVSERQAQRLYDEICGDSDCDCERFADGSPALVAIDW